MTINKYHYKRGAEDDWIRLLCGKRETQVESDLVSRKSTVAVVKVDVIEAGQVQHGRTADEIIFLRLVQRCFYDNPIQHFRFLLAGSAYHGESDALKKKLKKKLAVASNLTH